MKIVSLGNTGIQVPVLAMGAASLGSIYHPVSQQQANETVSAALENGVNYFDVAPYYGLTKAETALGKALQGIPRHQYTLATKVGRYGDSLWDFSREATLRSIDESLSRLGTDYIDVIQCHDIEYGDIPQLLDEALPVLRELKASGVVRHIGITGYQLDLLEQVACKQKVDTVMAYCTWTLQDRRLGDVARRLNQAGIGVLNASPLSMGLLTRGGAPQWHPAHQDVQQVCREVSALCDREGVNISQVALQFALTTAAEHGIATTVIGTASAENMLDNVRWSDQPLNDELLAQIDALMAPVLNIGWDILPGNGGKAQK
ncbi:aldo/keto reductase [Citrobacter portucalensis]|uniref:aldo/keto reductase n=1 Tax=Citrobacter portucalensis TaxID=1639133 RepID=UPI0022440AD1|nr:aldo/keto reductase [Citrobacter portucalensis]MCW8353809.1 aldo/keto reductase [Citrobacter portucalensis]MCX8995110.1 aldo/keto reductase [Citrobacter portucalensis]MCX9053617.1 aldo/keto reductase [Citrobacter portucalensis]MCX9058392.1 aldo/keto reductase [Citrobacter portucalensis]MCX9071005.1 aldo/keto reductase [Citrobacter portucalensis]